MWGDMGRYGERWSPSRPRPAGSASPSGTPSAGAGSGAGAARRCAWYRTSRVSNPVSVQSLSAASLLPLCSLSAASWLPLGCLSAASRLSSQLHLGYISANLGESRRASSRGRRPSAPPRRAAPRRACRRRPANPARAGDTNVRGGERAGEPTRLGRRAERSFDGFDTHPALLGSSGSSGLF